MARTSWDDYWQNCWKWKLTEKFLKSTLRQFVCQIKIALKYFFYCVFRTKFKALQKWFWPVILWFMKLFYDFLKGRKQRILRFFPSSLKLHFWNSRELLLIWGRDNIAKKSGLENSTLGTTLKVERNQQNGANVLLRKPRKVL